MRRCLKTMPGFSPGWLTTDNMMPEAATIQTLTGGDSCSLIRQNLTVKTTTPADSAQATNPDIVFYFFSLTSFSQLGRAPTAVVNRATAWLFDISQTLIAARRSGSTSVTVLALP